MKELSDLLDRPISFHRAFVDLTGSVQAALMLSQAFYWSKRTSDPMGWFYKTAVEWEEETGLTRREQETARKALRTTGFWLECKKGVPAKCFFRIDKSALFSSFTNSAKLNADSPIPTLQNGASVASVMAENANLSIKHTETTTEITVPKPSKEAREKEFGLLLAPFVEKYGKEMIRRFFDYWTEWDDEGKMMAWEIAKKKGKKRTFDIGKRLAYWKSNNFNGHANQQQSTTEPVRAEMPEAYHQLR